MLEFMRNKRVSVARKDPENFTIQAELDDSIYSLELSLTVRIGDLKCLAVSGNFRRWTTPECPRALDFLKQAEGFYLTSGIEDKIHKTIGRTSCRHFANLLIECAHAAQQSRIMVQWQQAKENDPDLSLREFMEGGGNPGKIPSVDRLDGFDEFHISSEDPDKGEKNQIGKEERLHISVKLPAEELEKKRSDNSSLTGFLVDLHVHTFPASVCASDSAEAMVKAAKVKGLDALCLTDHNYLWSKKDVDKLMDLLNFQIFRGNEITTDQGDMLVFGFYEPIDRVVKLSDLSPLVERTNGFIIAAHPFRGFLTFGTGQLGLTPEKAMEREMFKHVHALEALNGKVTKEENDLALKVAEGLKLPMTGGSDAHNVSNVGIYATRFKGFLTGEKELVKALHSDVYGPVSL